MQEPCHVQRSASAGAAPRAPGRRTSPSRPVGSLAPPEGHPRRKSNALWNLRIAGRPGMGPFHP